MRVLVIDDDPDVLLLCRVNLGHAGHEVDLALDGDRGLELARTERPDVIVLDLMLPNRDGFDVMEALAADRKLKDVPVMVLTARARWDDEVRSWQAGAADYLTKPFSPAALTEALHRVHSMTPGERMARRTEALSRLLTDKD
ncbi:MAG: response regulator [Actinobacteria bacterium]|nr:response regulator [Actinomycetota bacterium]